MAEAVREAEMVMRRLAQQDALPSETALRFLRSDLMELAQWWEYKPPEAIRVYWHQQAKVVLLRLLSASADEALASFVEESGLICRLEEAVVGDEETCRRWSAYVSALFIWHRILLKEDRTCT